MYEVFDHTADLGLRVRGRDLSELFAEAARGFLSILVRDPGAVRSIEERACRIEGAEADLLLLDWLNDLLFAFDTERLLLAEFDVRVDGSGLRGTGRGETMDPQRHEMDHEIKAITYHGLKVVRAGEGWLAEVIVDI